MLLTPDGHLESHGQQRITTTVIVEVIEIFRHAGLPGLNALEACLLFLAPLVAR